MKNFIKVVVGIVTFNSEKFIFPCLKSLEKQSFKNFNVIIIDNASTDNTLEILEQARNKLNFSYTILSNKKNMGFSAAHNKIIKSFNASYYFCVNPDVILEYSYLEKLLEEINLEKRIGMITGKIYKLISLKEKRKIIDSTGLYFVRNLRHLDRGAGDIDKGQYEKTEYVLGVSGAVALYKYEMIKDIQIDNEFFDEDFFAYREDADVSWRAQIMGWKALYIPTAIAYHQRFVTPERRKFLPSDINMHSVKNRFLLQIKNHTFPTWLKTFPYGFIRDIDVIGYVLIKEQTSLKGIFYVIKNIKKILNKRKKIIRKRKVSNKYLTRWFKKKSLPIK